MPRRASHEAPSQPAEVLDSLKYPEPIVLNQKHPTDEASHFLEDIASGLVQVEVRKPRHFDFADARLRDRGIFVEGEVVYKDPGNSGEFAGWYVARDYGRLALLELLLKPESVVKKGPPTALAGDK